METLLVLLLFVQAFSMALSIARDPGQDFPPLFAGAQVERASE